MNILHIYRKFDEKSRSFEPKKIDRFLFAAAAALVVIFIMVQLILRLAPGAGRTTLLLSRRCEELFGRDTAEALAREFEERNPGLRILLENEKDVKPKKTPNDAPDIVFFDEAEFDEIFPDMASLNSYIHSEEGAEQRAIPLVLFMDLLFYNIELLQAAGFDRPPKTRAEFLACAKAVSGAAGGPYGAALGLGPGDSESLRRDVFSWVWAAGGEIRPGANVFEDKAAADVPVFLARLYKDGSLAPGVFEKTGAERLAEFARGKIALLTASTRDIPLLRKEMGENAFGITVIPGGPGPGKSSLALSGIYAGINAASSHPDEAWTFLVYLAEKSPVFSAKLKAVPGPVSGSLSGSSPAANTSAENYISADPLYAKAWDIFEASELVQDFSGQPRSEAFKRAARSALQAAFTQQMNR